MLSISICLLCLPAWGWDYKYDANPGEDAAGRDGWTALDGTWNHDNESDNWDGSGLRSTIPGGLEIQTDKGTHPMAENTGTSYLRIQDPGLPANYGHADYNRKIWLAKDLSGIGAGNDFLDSGVFRMKVKWRLSTSSDNDAIDEICLPDRFGPKNAWPVFGEGYSIHGSGKGMITIHQVESDPGSLDKKAGKQIGFSLMHIDEQIGALVMNDLAHTNGNLSQEDVDFREGDPSGYQSTHKNILFFFLVNDWHTFDISIVADCKHIGTHIVSVIIDEMEPVSFSVTAGSENDGGDDIEYKDRNYIAIGMGSSRDAGAFDLDYLYLDVLPHTTDATATTKTFGDKDYWPDIDRRVEKVMEENPLEAVTLIKAEISKYPKWQQENPDQAQYADKIVNNLYFRLAQAMDAAGVDKNEIVDAYKRATASLSYSGDAFTWLYNNTTSTEQQNLIKQILDGSFESRQGLKGIILSMENANDWQAFEEFLNIIFDQTTDYISTAKLIETGLSYKTYSSWGDKFIEYCRDRPKLLEYVYNKDCKNAEELAKKEAFTKAISAYRDIVERYNTFVERKMDIEFRICQCLFKSGDYDNTLLEIDKLYEQIKAKNRTLAIETLLLKGQCYIQQGEIGKAVNEFLTLIIEYPEAKESPEANFFVGYCYMLQGKFDQAQEAFDLLIKNYPQSSTISKAKLCLSRIETMTK